MCSELGGEGEGGLALWLQLWLTAGDVMGTGVNQTQPSPATVCTGRSCPLLWGCEAAYGICRHFQGCSFSSSHRSQGEKASLLSPSWCWDIQGQSGHTQAVAADEMMRTNFPGTHLPLPWPWLCAGAG